MKMTVAAKPAIPPLSHTEDNLGASANPELCSLTQRGSITFAARRRGERPGSAGAPCWHSDRWPGCLSAAPCYRRLIAIDPCGRIINCCRLN